MPIPQKHKTKSTILSDLVWMRKVGERKSEEVDADKMRQRKERLEMIYLGIDVYIKNSKCQRLV